MTERLNSIDKRYQELQELAKLRKQRLLDALSLYKLFTEADGVEQWINEKEKMLVTMVPGKFLSTHFKFVKLLQLLLIHILNIVFPPLN